MGVLEFLSDQSADPLGGVGVYALIGGCILAIIVLIWILVNKGEFSRSLIASIVMSIAGIIVGSVILLYRYPDYNPKVEKRKIISEHDQLIYDTYGKPTDEDSFESPEIEFDYDRTTQ